MSKEKCSFVNKPFFATAFKSDSTEYLIGAPTVETLCFVLDRICTYHTGYDKKDFKNIILRPISRNKSRSAQRAIKRSNKKTGRA